MSTTVTELLDDAKSLSEVSRIDLAERILETLDYSDEVSKAHLEIIQRRVDEVKSGKVKLIPADDVFRDAEALLKARR